MMTLRALEWRRRVRRQRVPMETQATEAVIAELLARWRAGDERAPDELVGRLYGDLRVVAQRRLRDVPGHSLAPTELVHEAFVKLARSPNRVWADRCHFVNAAGAAMRSILVDRARAKQAIKRSGRIERGGEGVGGVGAKADGQSVLEIDEALTALEGVDPRAARVVTLRFFAGLTEPEIAAVLNVHERTVRRDWLFARAWLKRHIAGDELRTGRDGEGA